jgi:hypothetical protein
MKWAPWILVVALGTLALGLYRWGQARETAAVEAGRVTEVRMLREHGVLVAERDGLKEREAALLKANADVAAELERVKAIAPMVRVVRVVEVRTVPGPSLVPVALGDSLYARVSELGIRTQLGNESAVGKVAVFNDRDELVYSGRFDEKASRLTVEVPPADNRWPWWTHELIGLGLGVGVTLAARR